MGRRGKVNQLGLTTKDYDGRPSTLCVGCGHNSIASRIQEVAWEMDLPMHRVIKMSGIGCSSKSPAYFLGGSHGFNALHGRMPSVTTGAVAVNRSLTAISVSGDGDSGSIGMGQFKHVIRRNVPMVYIIENNGVYGLTKGQFSPTADAGQESKYAGGMNELPPIDFCYEAIIGGCGFVARAFSGDKIQMQTLLKAAIRHKGTALLDIISPCVTFNNHNTSSKGYTWVQEHDYIVNSIEFVPEREEIEVDYVAGEVVHVDLHGGGAINLRKVDMKHDPTDKMAAVRLLEQNQDPENIITGLIYINEGRRDLPDVMDLPQTPLVDLAESDLRPSREKFDALMAELR